LNNPTEKKEPRIILLVGDPKTGKTVSSCTFPKPLLLLDFDDGAKSIRQLPEVVKEQDKIDVETFKNNRVHTLSFNSSNRGNSAPAHTIGAGAHVTKMNKLLKEIKPGDYSTIIVDSLTAMFRVWKQNILLANRQMALQLQDYGTLEVVFFDQFLASLKALPIDNVILISHTTYERDDVSGKILEFPVGTSRQMGKNLPAAFDEVWTQKVQGANYTWNTRKTGLFIGAGSRLNLPPQLPALYSELEKHMKGR